MDRDTLIEIIEKLVGGARPVEQFILLTQLRAQCGSRRRKRTSRIGFLVGFGKSKRASKRGRGARIKSSCVECQYDLTGLEQVWFDEVSVGAAVCPECGIEYPAICK